MDSEHFLADFGHIANAPEGINRLREMIYNLAVTGALSEQRRSDGDGHSLLVEITAKKQELSDAGEYKRSPKLENLRDAFNENLPEIPSTWAWSRLVEVGEISPKNAAEDAAIASFASMSAISEMHSSPVACEDRPWANIKKGYTHFANGDVVLAKITPCFENGKAAVMANLTNGIGAGTTELHVVRPIRGVIEPGYIYVFLRSPYFKIVGEGHMTGTAGQKRLPTEYFATRPFPLPPLAEQKRIVAKVDKLMALCDQLEAQQQERERRFPVLSRTCHARFAEAPTPSNLNRVFDESGNVSPADLRKTILDLAARGKLVPQSHKERSMSEVLAKVEGERQRLISLRELRRIELVSPVSAAPPFDVPSNWLWVFPDQISKTVNNALSIGPFGSNLITSDYTTSGVPLVFVRDIRAEFVNEAKHYVSAAKASELAAHSVAPGDLLITKMGDPPGDTAIYPKHRPSAIVTADCIKWTVDDTLVVVRFLYHLIRAPQIASQIVEITKGAAHQKVSLKRLRGVYLPLPPLAEQRRIVAKVDELMALVDQLEAQQQERDKLAEAFAKACVASFTGTTQLERPEKMKAPKIELVSVVTLGKKPKSDANAPLAQLLSQQKGTLPAKNLWQQSGLTIDAFYQQLKTEIAQGWIAPPAEAEMKVIEEA